MLTQSEYIGSKLIVTSRFFNSIFIVFKKFGFEVYRFHVGNVHSRFHWFQIISVQINKISIFSNWINNYLFKLMLLKMFKHVHSSVYLFFPWIILTLFHIV